MDIQAHTISHGIDLQLVWKDYVLCADEDVPEYQVGGYFDEIDRKVLVVAVKRPKREWVANLAHEYAHFCQWINGYDFGDYIDCLNRIEAHTLQEEIISRTEAFKAIAPVQRVELDAERRAIRLIQNYGLTQVDLSDYRKAAFAYLLYYSMAAHTGHWAKRRVYDISECYHHLPDRLPTMKDLKNYRNYAQLFYDYEVFDDPEGE